MLRPKMECVLMNPGDIEAYIPTIKNALLFYDKINMVPESDVAFLMGGPLPQALNSASIKAVSRLKKEDQKTLKRMRKRINQRKTDKYSAALQYVQHMEEQKKQIIAQELNFDQIREISIQKGQEPWEKTKEIRREVKVLIEENLIHYPGENDPHKIAQNMTKTYMGEIENALKNMEAFASGKKLKRVSDATDISYKVWAEAATSMVALYDCPLLSSRTDFIERLRKNISFQAASFDNDNSQTWKFQHLALGIQDNVIPSLVHLTIEDVLELRLLTNDFLEPYRRALAKIADNIRNNPWDVNFKEEIQSVISKDVYPLLLEAKRAFNKHPPIHKLLKKAYRSFKEGWDSVSIVADIFPGSEPLLLAACIGTGIDGFINEYFTGTTEDASNSGMVFLIKAKMIIDNKAHRI